MGFYDSGLPKNNLKSPLFELYLRFKKKQVFFIHILDNLSTLIYTRTLKHCITGNYVQFFKGNFVDKDG